MTSDTFSNTLGFLVMGTGNDNNSWGTNANSSVFQIFEDSIANILSESVTGGTLDLSGSPPPSAASQTRFWLISFTGTLTQNQIVKVPNLSKGWVINNRTSGAFTLTMQTPSGSASTAIPQGGYCNVWCDGSNNINVSPYASSQLQSPDGSAAAPAQSFLNETGTGWYRKATQDMRLAVNGSDILQVTGSGAATASVVNVISGSLQSAGVQIVPSGVEMPFAGVNPPTGWVLEYGQTLSRSTNASLFNAITFTCSGNTNGNTTINGLSVNLTGLGIEGAVIEGTGISLGTTVVSVNSSTSITVSATVAGSNTGVSLRLLPYGQGDGSTTFNVPDRRGRVVIGRDNMGGTAAGRVTVNAGTHLSTSGGEEQHTLTGAELPVTSLTPSSPGFNATSGFAGGTTIPLVPINMSSAGVTNPSGSSNVALLGTNVNISINASSLTTSFGSGASHNTMQPFGITNMMIKL